MSSYLQCFLLAFCVCSVCAHNDFDFDEKGLDNKDRDARKENRLTETNHGITTDARHLNEYRDKQGDHHDKDDRSHGKSGNHQNKDNDNEHRSEEKHGTHRFEDNDDDHRSEEKHGDHRFNGSDNDHRFNGSDNDHRSEEEHGTQRFKDNDDDHRSEEKHEDHRFERNDEDHQPEDEYEATHENRLPGEGHIVNGTRSKNSSGGHLRAHNDRKGTRENKDEDDGFGLPILIGSVGAALIFGLVLAGIVVLCYRRRISTKSSVVEIGVAVVGQPVAGSVLRDAANANGNWANKVSK